ncbi:MAG: Nif3-like dinuclear metal center hexameric protein [Nocardioides sp.]|uniref:Nif3-like dinuclear metal center hexameric protein n=1 Tax=Nocardioides sp. TaxID=35761 RepID=UPI0039E2BCC0
MTSPAPTLAEVMALLDEWYPPHTADGWDAVGLVYGDPAAEVRKVMFAVDPVQSVAEEAAGWGADLLVVHHPLFLKPVHGVPATTPKGRTLATLAAAGCALLTAHTNADQAIGGVSESLALALGLTDLAPLVPAATSAAATGYDKLTVYVPSEHAEDLRRALAAAGAGRLGDYEAASFSSPGEGRFRPLPGATPRIGRVGDLEIVDEVRVECLLPRRLRGRVIAALLATHPYEEPAYDVVELAPLGPAALTGTGRVGAVEPTTLAGFAERVAAALPATAAGIRVAGDPERPVTRVALCGGAGDFLLDQLATSDADVYLTSDLRHHPASEFLDKGGPALIDVPHWAAEWTWLPVVARRLREALCEDPEQDRGRDLPATRVSTLVTDPWTLRL